jgi:hypothetical protein
MVVISIVENGVLCIVVRTQNEQTNTRSWEQVTRRTGGGAIEQATGNAGRDQRNTREKSIGDYSQAEAG